MLSASANKLSKLKEQAEGYASLIMEELDPENLGYIEVIRLGKKMRTEQIDLLGFDYEFLCLLSAMAIRNVTPTKR